MTQFDPVAFGQAMGVMVKEAVAPLLERIEALEQAAPPDVVGELLATDKMATLIDIEVERSVAAYFEANPVQHGKDGEPGPRGEKGVDGVDGKDGANGVNGKDGRDGADGADGKPGRDGLDVKDMFRAEGGRLVAVLSDGTTKDLGKFVGDPGKDGADFSQCEIEYDGERTITIKGAGGVLVKRVPLPFDRGYWGEGSKAEKGDIVTHNGVAWIATGDTEAEPIAGADGWRVFARKGKDGKDGHVVRVPESVKIRG